MTDYTNYWGGPGLATFVLACGESKRFQDEGYEIPKQFLRFYIPRTAGAPRAQSNFMCENVLAGMRTSTIVTTIGLLAHDRWLELIANNVLMVDRSRGQAETALYAMSKYSIETYTDVLLVNCDNGFAPGVLDLLVSEGRAKERVSALTMEVDATEVSRWSFVDDWPLFTTTGEKQLISGCTHALAGAYYIPRRYFDEFRNSLSATVNNPSGREPYISHALRGVNGYKLGVGISREDFYDWGMPSALEEFMKENTDERD